MFSYTIISIPNTTGKVFVGGTKQDFPICIVNPIKSKQLKKDILNYVHIQLNDKNNIPSYDDSDYYKRQYKQFNRWFYGRLNKIPDIKLSAIKSQKNEICILLEAADNREIQCVVFMNKRTKEILKIVF